MSLLLFLLFVFFFVLGAIFSVTCVVLLIFLLCFQHLGMTTCSIAQLLVGVLGCFVLSLTGWVWLWWAYREKERFFNSAHPFDVALNYQVYHDNLKYRFHWELAMRCQSCRFAVDTLFKESQPKTLATYVEDGMRRALNLPARTFF